MNVNDFIKELERIAPTHREKEIVIQCPNGLLVEPKVKFLVDTEKIPTLDNMFPTTGQMVVTWQD